MKSECTHYQGQCDHLVCPREVKAKSRVRVKTQNPTIPALKTIGTVDEVYQSAHGERAWVRFPGGGCFSLAMKDLEPA